MNDVLRGERKSEIAWWLPIVLLACAFVTIFPLFATPFLLRLATLIMFWAYLGQCWNILSGYAGQFSFGHAAYFGLGAYTSTWLLVNKGINPWIGMLLGGIIAMAAGLLIGFLCFR